MVVRGRALLDGAVDDLDVDTNRVVAHGLRRTSHDGGHDRCQVGGIRQVVPPFNDVTARNFPCVERRPVCLFVEVPRGVPLVGGAGAQDTISHTQKCLRASEVRTDTQVTGILGLPAQGGHGSEGIASGG
jgi:hypothetical protein